MCGAIVTADWIGGPKPICVKCTGGELGHNVSPLFGGGGAAHPSPTAIRRNLGERPAIELCATCSLSDVVIVQ
jgi:hypothetical protein